MKRLLWAGIGLLCFVAHAAAQSGLNLAWNRCGGEHARTFACDTNAGGEVLVASFSPPVGVGGLTGFWATVDVQSAEPALPDWWQLVSGAACRRNAMSVSFDSNSDPGGGCVGYYDGIAEGYLHSYAVSGATARLAVVGALTVTPAIPMDPGPEYFGFRLAMSHAATTGPGACAGCAVPACIVFDGLKLTQPVGVGDIVLSTPLHSNCVTWQGGVASCCLVPARNRTWGEVKALYR